MTAKSQNLKWLCYVAAGLSIAGGVIHGIVTPEHFEEWWGYGLFFLISTIAQIGYGVFLLWRPWTRLLNDKGASNAEDTNRTVIYCIVGIVGNLLIIGLWILTRTIGVPDLGPAAGEIEEVTLLSLASKVIEVGLIACLLLIIRHTKFTARLTQGRA